MSVEPTPGPYARSARDLSQVAGCELLRLLGQGAMGEVYLARRHDDGEVVVVKFLVSALADPLLLRRFEREGAALRAVPPHPCIVRVLDAQAAPRPCLVLEFVEGVTLLRHLQEHGPMAPLEAARVARDVARGLEVVHARGLLHRDIKPANLILTLAGQVKVVDFGLAKDQFASALTEPGQLLGTGPYMAPERWTGDAADEPAGDVYALGATLFQLIAGRPPFDGVDLAALGELVLRGERPRLRELAPDTPEELERVIEQMLAPERRHRYARMRDVVDDLERVLHDEPCRAPCLTLPGRRIPLVPGRRFILGSGPACEARVEGAQVAPQHAQLRRTAEGWELRDLRSPAGTLVGAARLTRPHLLRDGELLRLGDVALSFEDPRARPAPPPFLDDVSRRAAPAPLVEALARLPDPRAAGHLLEALRDDPLEGARARRVLEAALGSGSAPLVARHAELASRRAAWAAQQLATLAAAPRPDVEGWLLWWDEARARLPLQLDLQRPGAALRLRVARGEPAASETALGDEPTLLVGRDARCHVRLTNRSVSRLHATLRRVHRRLLVVDEGRATPALVNGRPARAAFLDPGDVLTLGEVELALVWPAARDEPAPDGAVDAVTWAALEEAAHPAIAAALVAWLAPPAERAARARDLAALVEDPARVEGAVAALLEDRARRARALLTRILGQDAGDDPRAWAPLLAARGGPQLRPAGWE